MAGSTRAHPSAAKVRAVRPSDAENDDEPGEKTTSRPTNPTQRTMRAVRSTSPGARPDVIGVPRPRVSGGTTPTPLPTDMSESSERERDLDLERSRDTKTERESTREVPKAAPEPTPHTKPRVLCVDDDEAVLSGISRVLGRRFEVVTAGSADQALHLLADEEAPPFAVILADLRMPGINGADFLTRARNLHPKTMRLMLTGHMNLDAMLTAVNDAQVFRFLTKPCDSHLIEETVAEAAASYANAEAAAKDFQAQLDAARADSTSARRLAAVGTFSHTLAQELSELVAAHRRVVDAIRRSSAAGRPVGSAHLDELSRIDQRLQRKSKELASIGSRLMNGEHPECEAPEDTMPRRADT